MIQANPTVEQPVADCPYCDRPIDGRSVNRLHPQCHEFFNAEMVEAFPEEDAPQEPDFFPAAAPRHWPTDSLATNFDDALCVF